MYSIIYSKDTKNNQGIYKNIEGITIDVKDIKMMKYIDVLHKGDKYLVTLYVKYLKLCHKKKKELSTITILNDNPNNEKIISSIIDCPWLINEYSLTLNSEEYKKRKEVFQKEIEFLKNSKKLNEQHQVMLMQYFIDEFDDNIYLDELKDYVKKIER